MAAFTVGFASAPAPGLAAAFALAVRRGVAFFTGFFAAGLAWRFAAAVDFFFRSGMSRIG